MQVEYEFEGRAVGEMGSLLSVAEELGAGVLMFPLRGEFVAG